MAIETWKKKRQQNSILIIDELITRFEKFSKPGQKLRAELNLQLRREMSRVARTGTLKFKRLFDIVGSAAGILALSPVFMAVMAAIKIEDGGSIIYTSKRVGRHGKEFDFYKFRSMVEDADKLKDLLLNNNESEAGVIFKMKNDPRITKVGRFIRRTSIDELPQLFNVLLGNMSLVGPRPPLPQEVIQYKVGDRYRLEVIPGLTCIWQVSGRSNLDFHQQVQLDREYIYKQTLLNDIKLILRTIPAVLSGHGSY
jgi:lipopolysaccharide/colanic/teichoic acid biosynthesis glycosyltransferase